LSGSRSLATTTDPNGGYAFQNLDAAGEYSVTPQKTGYTFNPELRYYSGLATDVTSSDFVANAPVNQPPSVALAASSTTIAMGGRLTFNAAATDVDNGIAGVAFYVDQKLLATDTTSPYSVSWKPSRAGTYSVIATATDIAGSTATSQPIAVTVTSKPRR